MTPLTRSPPPETPTIDQVKAVQFQQGREGEHVVWIGPRGFAMAHTDEERATIELCDCPLHIWMVERDHPPVHRYGYYAVTVRPHDPTSESFRGDGGRWDFEFLKA